MQTSTKFHGFAPEAMPQPELYKILTGSILPRPIAWVTTLGPQGPNLAPFSFYMGVASAPPTVAFSIAWKLDRKTNQVVPKDTLKNLQTCPEFVIHLCTEDHIDAMNQSSAEYPWGVDEIKQTGLTTLPSSLVRPPRIEESPIQFECKVSQALEVGPREIGGATLILGQIVQFHFRRDVWEAMKDPMQVLSLISPISRLGGSLYAPIGTPIPKARPKL